MKINTNNYSRIEAMVLWFLLTVCIGAIVFIIWQPKYIPPDSPENYRTITYINRGDTVIFKVYDRDNNLKLFVKGDTIYLKLEMN